MAQMNFLLPQGNPYPDQDLIVWQANGYHEIKASPILGVPLGDYHAK